MPIQLMTVFLIDNEEITQTGNKKLPSGGSKKIASS
jgi:hypothetical protein